MQGLPADAATWRDDEQWTWQRVAARLDTRLLDLTLIHAGQKVSLPPPLTFARPGDEPDPPQQQPNVVSVAEFARSHQKTPEGGEQP